MSKKIGERTDSFENLKLIPQTKEAKIALQFAKIAKNDYKASKLLYQNKLYPQAVYMLQQAVEKAIKSFGLMTGFVKPKDIMKVGHRSVHALLFEMENLAKDWGSVLRSQQAYINSEPRNLRLIDPLVQKATNLIPSESAIKHDKTLIGNLKAEQMWKDTLNLDIRNSVVKHALDTLENIQWDKPKVAISMRILVEIGKLKKDNAAEMDYFLGIFRSSPRTYGLSMLTMWHEIPPRYPPVPPNDYWKEDQYTAQKPLIEKFPFILKHTKILVDNVYKSGCACSRMSSQNKKGN